VTASAWILSPNGRRFLLTHHRKLGRWLQLGGHCDGDANLAGTALREACEESGIADLSIEPLPLDLDVHTIPARPGEPEHLHLDTRFVVWAPPHARVVRSDESHALGWFAPSELAAIDVDDSVRRLFARVFG
jgi:8-oxo-dGTP pyrophosphatase MutT (NUDIX family)